MRVIKADGVQVYEDDEMKRAPAMMSRRGNAVHLMFGVSRLRENTVNSSIPVRLAAMSMSHASGFAASPVIGSSTVGVTCSAASLEMTCIPSAEVTAQ